jgi:hypothetical protein
VRFKNGRRKAPLWAGLELRGARVGLSRLPIGFVWPRHLQIGAPPLQHLISFRSAECCERGRCVPAIVGVRVALAHDELRIVQNNSERQSTSGRSTDCGTGHLIRAFHDIGRMFSLLFPLSHPSPVGHQPRRRVQNRTTEYGFVEGKNGFICVSWGTFESRRVVRSNGNPPEQPLSGPTRHSNYW